MFQPRAIHWVAVLGLAIALHLSLFLRFQNQRTTVAQDAGSKAITIALAPESVPEPVAKPKPEPKPKPKPKPKPEPEPVPKPASEPKPQPDPVATPVPDPEPATPQRTSAPPPNPVQREEKTMPQTQTGATGGIADTPPDYRSKLSAWLEQHKDYPRRARRLGQEGTAVLHFVINREGRVLEWELRSSSGHRLLDSAVKEMIQRANPLPPMPESLRLAKLELTVPVNFLLR